MALAAVDHGLEMKVSETGSPLCGGSIRNSADIIKAIALGADAVNIASAALITIGATCARNVIQIDVIGNSYTKILIWPVD